MRDIFLLLFALAFFFLSGRLLMHFVDRNNELEAGPFVKGALAFMLGLGCISLEMFFYSLARIPYGILYIAAPWAALSALMLPAFIKNPRSSKGGFKLFFSGAGFGGLFFLLIIFSQVIYAFLYGIIPPISSWDAYQTWFFKANVFFKDRGVVASFFDIPLVHPDYPLLIPLSAAWVYTCLGYINDVLVRAIYPLQYVSLLLIFYYLVKRTSSVRTALVFSALLSITPIIMVHGAGLPVRIGELYTGDFVGYADLALSIYFLAAAGFFYLYVIEETKPQLFLTALFLGLGAWTKDEGFVFALLGGLMVLGHMALTRKTSKTGWVTFLFFIGILSLVAGPWVIYKSILRIPGEYDRSVGPATFINNLNRLPAIFSFIGFILFKKVSLYNFTWYAYVVSNIVRWRKAFRRPLLYLNLIVAAQISVYVFVFIITYLDLDFHLKTSVDRLAMQLTPLAMFIVAANLSGFLRSKEPADR